MNATRRIRNFVIHGAVIAIVSLDGVAVLVRERVLFWLTEKIANTNANARTTLSVLQSMEAAFAPQDLKVRIVVKSVPKIPMVKTVHRNVHAKMEPTVWGKTDAATVPLVRIKIPYFPSVRKKTCYCKRHNKRNRTVFFRMYNAKLNQEMMTEAANILLAFAFFLCQFTFLKLKLLLLFCVWIP